MIKPAAVHLEGNSHLRGRNNAEKVNSPRGAMS